MVLVKFNNIKLSQNSSVHIFVVLALLQPLFKCILVIYKIVV